MEPVFKSTPIYRRENHGFVWFLIILLVAINMFFWGYSLLGGIRTENSQSFVGNEAPRHLPELLVMTKPRIAGYIVEQAMLDKLDPIRVLRIAQCESSLNPKAKHKVSSASGLFAFTTATFKEGIKKRNLDWKAEDVFDVEKNTDMALWYMSKGDWKRWVCK